MIIKSISSAEALAKADVRDDCSERAFRRYEEFIARACKGSYELNLENDARSTRTFKIRMQDAIRGYNRYHYKSTMIPPGYDLSRIKIVTTRDGYVCISNPHADAALLAAKSVEHLQFDPVAILAKLSAWDAHRSDDFPSASKFSVSLSSPEQVQFCSDAVQSHNCVGMAEGDLYHFSYYPRHLDQPLDSTNESDISPDAPAPVSSLTPQSQIDETLNRLFPGAR